LADADALMSRAKSAKHVVVAGAGFIGLEFAAVAASLGAQVHVIELADRPMARALSRPMSQLFRAAHEGWGVTFDFNQGLAAVHGHNGQVTEVQTTSGQRLPAELLVYGIGVLPNTQLAAEAELTVDNGIEVDAHMLTRDPWISAIGDAVSFPCVHADGARLRLESVQNALDQARLVAARLAGRTTSPYSAMPWFWSDQGNLKLQIAGLSTGHDETVVIGSLAESKISVLCFRQQQLIAVESCNRPADHMVARKVLARRAPLRPAEAAAPGFELATYEAGGRIAN
jgi:NADPH-dependent 2,4-dienoyl-CoA reductase/sulfur reductase-like enzyme